MYALLIPLLCTNAQANILTKTNTNGIFFFLFFVFFFESKEEKKVKALLTSN